MNKGISKYSRNYSDEKLEAKFGSIPKKYSCKIVFAACVLYYVMKADTTPKWVVVEIIAALGYLITPVDFIPDILFPFGYADDLAVLTGLFASAFGIKQYVSPDIIKKAKEKSMKIIPSLEDDTFDYLVKKWNLNEMD